MSTVFNILAILVMVAVVIVLIRGLDQHAARRLRR